ncbi:MAG: response regulator transcription factor [Chthoniobacterales bacterium]|nr:response regulator transcription factor [Chthoniobacterales bacterium]
MVDDAEIIRRGITAIISAEPDFSICDFAGNEATAVKLLERHQPDLLPLDLSLGHRDGVQFLKDIAGRFVGTRIIALSDYGDPLYVTRTLRAGAAGYLTKHPSAAQLITTLRTVAADDTLLRASRKASQREVRPQAGAPARTIASLIDRELHVFRLIGTGLGTSRIAQELGLSRKTIETYREHIKLKLSYPNAEALLKGALDWAALSQNGSPDTRKDRGNPR